MPKEKVDRTRICNALMDLSQLAVRVAESMDGQIEQASKLLLDCLLSGGKVLACGNGGSAADAQHFVTELVGRMEHDRQPLPAISLSSDPSVVTALSNDYGYEQIFARQIEGLGQPGDLLLALSTSGHSPNVLQAIKVAQQRGLNTIALVGAKGDPLLAECDICLRIPARNAQRIQELHMAVLHAMCGYVETQIKARITDEKPGGYE